MYAKRKSNIKSYAMISAKAEKFKMQTYLKIMSILYLNVILLIYINSLIYYMIYM